MKTVEELKNEISELENKQVEIEMKLGEIHGQLRKAEHQKMKDDRILGRIKRLQAIQRAKQVLGV